MLGKVILKSSGSKGFGDVVRYIARDRADQAKLREQFGVPEMGTVNLDCPTDDLEDRTDAIAILDSTAAAVLSKQKTGNPAYHIVFSWKEGEHPTRQQVEQAAAHVMKAVGMDGHQAIWAIHKDTDSDHVHLVINRVHPDTYKMQKVQNRDWLSIDRAMREIEGMQGWKHANGPWIAAQREVPGQKPEIEIVRMSRAERRRLGLLKDPGARVSDKAHRAEQNIGADSFQAWVTGAPGSAIRRTLDAPSPTWQDIHDTAARYGCTIAPKGSGMIVTTTLGDGRILAAKASQLGRWASKAELEKRLGPYQPPNPSQIKPSMTYQHMLDGAQIKAAGPAVRADRSDRTDKRLEREAARTALAERFKAEQAQLRKERPAQRKALTERHRAERLAMSAQARQRRAAEIAQNKRDGMSPQIARSFWAKDAAEMREELQKRQAAERKALTANVPRSEVWRTWLEKQAEAGDEAAKAALRGIHYREQRKTKQYQGQDGIEGEELDPLRKLTVAALTASVDERRQLVIYRGQDGREKFTDTGPRIVMHDKGGDSLEAALRIAAQKYGGKVDITGSSEFRERAAREAVRLGITVANEDLAAIVADEQAKRQRHPIQHHKEQHHERPDYARINPERARAGQRAAAVYQSNLAAHPPGAAPESLASVRNLSGVDLVQHQSAQVFLHKDAPDRMGSAKLTDPAMRRPGTGTDRDPGTSRLTLSSKDFLAAEAVLGRLPSRGWDALEAAGKGKPLTPTQKALLVDPARSVLISSDGKLNELGRAAFKRMEDRATAEKKKMNERRQPGVTPPGVRERARQPTSQLPTETVDNYKNNRPEPAPIQAMPGVPKKDAVEVSAQAERVKLLEGCSGRYGRYDGAGQGTLQSIVDAVREGNIEDAAQIARQECRAAGLSGKPQHLDRRLGLMAFDLRPMVGREAAEKIEQSIRQEWLGGRGLLDVEKQESRRGHGKDQGR